MVRETLAITAYETGDFALALREFRTYRRISGRDDQLPLMVDSERGVGRADRALELGRSVDRATLAVQVQVSLAIAMSGARLDLGQPELALAELEIPQLDPERAFSWSPALFGAYAEVLDELGRGAEASEWRGRALRAEAALEAAADAEVFHVYEIDEIEEIQEVDEIEEIEEVDEIEEIEADADEDAEGEAGADGANADESAEHEADVTATDSEAAVIDEAEAGVDEAGVDQPAESEADAGDVTEASDEAESASNAPAAAAAAATEPEAAPEGAIEPEAAPEDAIEPEVAAILAETAGLDAAGEGTAPDAAELAAGDEGDAADGPVPNAD
ncbi:hypothetical protein ACDF64_12590 [Agromyces sp. MMS24-JH15]|uniref:hypothetical protein n=1 Tax=Agromyces sp. MMS24-JH15 TaxID=3243765 RepID=UPI003747EF04